MLSLQIKIAIDEFDSRIYVIVKSKLVSRVEKIFPHESHKVIQDFNL